MSKLLDVVTTVTDRRVADALLLGGVEAPEGPRDIQGCASKKGCAHVEASGWPLRMAQLRGFRNGLGAARPWEARGCSRRFPGMQEQKPLGLGFMPLHYLGSRRSLPLAKHGQLRAPRGGCRALS